MITFIDEKGTEHSALVAYSVTNAVNGELSVKGTIYTNDKVLHGIGRGWRFRLDDEYYRITYAKPNDTGRQIEVEFDAVHQFFYDMSKSMVYTTLNGSKSFETYLQAIFSGSGYTYNLETTVGSIRKENFGNKSRLSLFNDIIKAAGLEFSVRGHVIRILKRVGTDLSTIVRKDFNMNELKIEKDINSFVTYQRGLGAWKDDEDHSKGRYETSYESPLSAIYGRIEADPVVDERYKDTGKLLERLKENVDKSYKVSVEIDMEDLSQAGYRISRPNPGDYIMAINETLGFRQKVRIVSFTSEYDVGGKLISRKVVCNDIGTVQRATSEISHLSRTLTDSIEESERALKTATRALVSADGKNTNYFGDVKPLDVPKGTLRKGDRLFLTVGDKKQLYFWNGAEWELEPTEFDHEKFDIEFNRKSQEIKKAIQENRQKSEEALRNAGASSLLAQEAKRIGLDSITRLEEFKRQATSAQTALSGDLDVLKRTIANDIRPKQAQAEAEIAKQVEALIQTKKGLAGVKSAQATYEETTTRRLAELTNLANGKASKSELTQTAEELTSKIASVQVGGTNLYALSKNKNILRSSHLTDLKFDISSGEVSFRATGLDPYFGEATVHPKSVSDRNGVRIPVIFEKAIYITVSNPIFTKNYISYFDENGNTVKSYKSYKSSSFVIFPKELEGANFITMRFGCGGSDFEIGSVIKTKIKVEYGTIPTDWSPAPEDIEGQISTVESNFKQRADSLDAGVNRLTEGLRTKADISSVNVTAENIRQSVKSLETSTQNKLDQKLSLAEFEVRASGIRQEILNITKDKADKTLVTAEAGKLREELASLSVGGVNLLKKTKTFSGVNGQSQLLSETYKNCAVRYFKNTDSNSAYQDIVAYYDALYPELGGTYTLSFWAKGTGEMTTFFYGQRGFLPVSSGTTSQGLVSKAGDGNCRFTLSADWQRYYVFYKLAETPAEAINIYKHVLFRHVSRSTTDEIWLAGVKLERGNLATDYSENPEDTEGLITEAKATFERTAQGLRVDLAAVQAYVSADGTRAEALRTYSREETARQLTAERKLIEAGYVAKTQHTEDVRGLTRRFEELAVGGRNLALGTSKEWSTPFTSFTGNPNIRPQLYKVLTDGLQVGDTLRSKIILKYTDVRPAAGKTATVWLQGNGNVTGWTPGAYNGSPAKTLNGSGEITFEHSFKITENHLKNTYWNWMFRTDFIASGSLQWRLAKVESGAVFTSWSPAPEDLTSYADTKLAEFKQGIDGQLASVQAALNTANGSLTNFNTWKQSAQETLNKVGKVEIGLNETKTSLAEFKRTAEGQLTTITQQIAGKANQTEFQQVQETSKLYERLIGSTEKEITDKVSRMALSNELFQVEVSKNEGLKTVQSQLAGSWGVHNKNSVNEIIAGFNLAGRNAGIKAETIRLEGNTLADKLTAIDGYFKRLFVGEGTFATLNTDILRANSITADKLVMDIAMARRFVSSDLFTDTLVAKEAFINKLRSVVVTAILLEGYKGRIGGFQIGTHDNDPSSFWLTGLDQFKVGMSNGRGREFQTAFWANWGNSWGKPGPLSWYVTLDGKMYCNNDATFHRVVDFSSKSVVNFYGSNSFHKNIEMVGGTEIYGTGSTPRSTGRNAVVWWNQVGDGTVKYWIDRVSDRRLKRDIVDTDVNAINKINQLKMVAFDFIKTGKHEEIGLIAQEVEAILPSAISKNPEKEDDYLHIDYVAIVPYLIKAIQELNQKIEKLEKTA